MARRTTIAGAALAVERLFREQARALKRGGGMRVIGETIMTDVKASRPGHGVPVDTGVLRASGRVTGPDPDGSVELSFGGASVTYALKQHENTALRHTIGEARYLVRGIERFNATGGKAAMIALRKQAALATARAAV